MDRATIDLNREVLDAVRAAAEEQGTDERELVEDAVGFYLYAIMGRNLMAHGFAGEAGAREHGGASRLRERSARRIREAAGRGGREEGEARALALSLVREAREEATVSPPEDVRPPLSAEETRESMEARRDARRSYRQRGSGDGGASAG